MRSIRWRLLATASVGALMAALVLMVSAPTAQAKNWDHLTKMQKRLASGAMSTALAPATAGCVNPTGGGDEGDEADNECAPDSYASPSSTTAAKAGSYTPTGNGGCAENLGNNVKVNQNCLNLTDPDLQGRGQAQNETSIAQDPNNPDAPGRQLQRLPPRRRQLLRRVQHRRRPDAGATRTVPMSLHPRRRPFGAARAVLAGRRRHLGRLGHQGQRLPHLPDVQARQRRDANPDLSSAFFVFRSTGNDGASWNFPGRSGRRAQRRRRHRDRCSWTSS